MTKWAIVLGIVGAVWMTVLLCTGSPRLAAFSNYPGVFAARWVQYRGIAPSTAMVWAFNIWLILTSAIEWIAVGLAVRAIMRRLWN